MGYGDLLLVVPKHQVGVASHRDRSLLRIETVTLGMVGRGQRHEAVQAYPALAYAFGKKDRHARRDPGYAVGNVAEARLALGAALAGFVLVAERAVIGRLFL